jgi:hypothetical protein
MSNLLVAARPHNLRYDRNVEVSGDVYNICDRLAELDPSLYIYPLDPPVALGDKVYRFSVIEQCGDGVDRLVMRVTELDARILEHIQYLLRVPFKQRFAEAERRADLLEAEHREAEMDSLVETMGMPMLRQLHHDGFSQRRTVYAPTGVTGGRGSRPKA